MIKLKLWLYGFLGIVFASLLAVFNLTRARNTKLAKKVEVLEINAKIQQELHATDILISKTETVMREKKRSHQETEEELDELEKKIGLETKTNLSRQADENFTSINR